MSANTTRWISKYHFINEGIAAKAAIDLRAKYSNTGFDVAPIFDGLKENFRVETNFNPPKGQMKLYDAYMEGFWNRHNVLEGV